MYKLKKWIKNKIRNIIGHNELIDMINKIAITHTGGQLERFLGIHF